MAKFSVATLSNLALAALLTFRSPSNVHAHDGVLLTWAGWCLAEEVLEAWASLEDWLGAKVRERGPRAGLTMMARLPRWMKASTNRTKVLRGLAQLRELAEKSGIDE